MTAFTTRVELHGAERREYDSLHLQMGARGFTRTIVSDDGITYNMPWAEYNYVGAKTRDQVLESARAAVAALTPKRDAAILVTESAGRTWHGLTKVQARAA
jgi:hypothetical protein